LAKAVLENFRGEMRVEIVSTDDWRDEGFYADFKPENERLVRKDALRYTKELIGNGVSVIHDDTNYYTSMRHELFEVAMGRPCNFAVIHVSTSFIHYIHLCEDTDLIYTNESVSHRNVWYSFLRKVRIG